MTERDHWQHIYTTRSPVDVGWYEEDPAMSRRLIADAVAAGARSVIDIGGGASSLVDHLLDMGLEQIAVLDISEAGLLVAQARLGDRASAVQWIPGDVTTLEDVGHFDIWHDRAVFHFLLEEEERRRYAQLAARTINPGGTAIVATFAPDGPERCSGLPVRRYDAEQLALECGPLFRLQSSQRYRHTTPGGVTQQFQYATLSRA